TLTISSLRIACQSRRVLLCLLLSSFFFNDTATTEIYTLSLHDALPISRSGICCASASSGWPVATPTATTPRGWRTTPSTSCCSRDRKSTRLNSSHLGISYAVFCLKKKIANASDHSSVADCRFLNVL